MNEIEIALRNFKELKIDFNFEIEKGKRRRFKYAEGNGWEILLLVWGIDSNSSIHNHNGSQGWIRILEGHLLEKTFDETPKFQKQSILTAGTESYIDDHHGTHQILNPFDSVAVSLHFYSPPVSNCFVFDEMTQTWTLQELRSETGFIQEAVLP
jgi:hypothetical protein